MKYPHLWGRIYGTPLLLTPEKAAIIEQVFRSHLHGEAAAIAQPDDAPLRASASYAGIRLRPDVGKPYDVTESGIALLPVIGTLVQRGSWLDAASGLVSYDVVASQLDVAMNDGEVSAILLEVDSDGGEATGIVEMGDRIISARGTKPVWSIANEAAYSAGYWIACSAERMYVPITGGVCNIGARAMHVDQSKRDLQTGYSYTYIFDGAHKVDGNPHEPLSDPARAWIQAEINRMGLLFREHVAAMRGLTEEEVRATQALSMSPPLALEQGYVDGILTMAETIAELEDHLKATKSSLFTGARPASQSTSPRKETSMTTESQQGAGVTLTAEQQQEQARQIEAARVTAEKTGREAGVKAERERIAAITGCEEAKQRTSLARHIAHDTDMSLEAAKKMLAASPVEAETAANPLAAAMSNVKNPKVGADGEGGDGGEEDADTMARRVAGFTPKPRA